MKYFSTKKVLSLPHGFWTGSYELGSVRLSFHPLVFLSRSSPGIRSLVLSETEHNVRCPCSVLHDRTTFCPKNAENGPNGPKILCRI